MSKLNQTIVDEPPENPAISVTSHFIEESLELIDDAIELTAEYIPHTSVPRNLSWVKRKLMWIKRVYKRYRVWSHKLGKFEMDPKIRSESRNNRQNVRALAALITDMDRRLTILEDRYPVD